MPSALAEVRGDAALFLDSMSENPMHAALNSAIQQSGLKTPQFPELAGAFLDFARRRRAAIKARY